MKRRRKVSLKPFQRLAVSKGRALVARRNERNSPFGVFFLLAFSFAPFESKEKAELGEDLLNLYRFIKIRELAARDGRDALAID